jgi:hypothetical protein
VTYTDYTMQETFSLSLKTNCDIIYS